MQMHNGSVSAHVKRLAKLGWKGMKPEPKPVEVTVEHELGYLVSIYERLRRQNTLPMDGVNPITFTEIKAFDDLAGTEIDPFDLDTLEKLDAVWRNCLPKRS